MPRASMRALGLALACLAASCSTIGSDGQGDVGLPSAGVGPFRKLVAGEVNGVAPFVLEDAKARFRDPAVLALPGGGAALYLTATQPDGSGGTHAVLVRTRADDGRSFFGAPLDSGHTPRLVLAADAPWEGTDLGGASPLRVSDPEAGGDEVVLFYAGAGGIGLARSADGLDFHKDDGPVLDATGAPAWETTPPRAPSVARLPDGRFRMVYAAGRCLGEAESTGDLRVWRRLDADPSTPVSDPLLCPAAIPAPGSLLPGEQPPFDTDAVDDPLLLPRITPAGRLQIRVLYTGYAAATDGGARPSAIGFAGRYGDTGPLERATGPVFSVGRHEAGPALFDLGDGTELLYVGEDHDASGGLGGGGGAPYSAIGAGFAPANEKLAAPAPFATSP